MLFETHLTGQAGEYLTAFDLAKNGFTPILTPEALDYDIIVDVSGRLIKLQVKSLSKPRVSKIDELIYEFSLRRERKSSTLYTKDNIDGFALATIEHKSIMYIPFVGGRKSLSFRVGGTENKYVLENTRFIADNAYSFKSFMEKINEAHCY